MYLLILTVGIFLIFLIVRKWTNTGMMSGLLFNLFLGSAGLWVFLNALHFEDNPVVRVLLSGLGLIVLAVLVLGIYLLLAFLVVNTITIVRRERFSLAHILTMILAALIIVYMIATTVISSLNIPMWVRILWSGVIAVVVFFQLHIWVFLTTLILTNIFKPRKNRDYIIVLGSGLIKGQVPPLLGGRIKAAVRFAKTQQAKGKGHPYLVMSGGQGDDEPRSEAAAMKEYALAEGYDEEQILTETESRNTLENMKFSQKQIEEHGSEKNCRVAYATSSYHLFRAGLYARMVGMHINGIGARTAFYYLPNAVLREYIAYLAMHKKRFIIISAILFALASGIGILNELVIRGWPYIII